MNHTITARRCDLLPVTDQERELVKEACATSVFARITLRCPGGTKILTASGYQTSSAAVVYTDPAQLRFVRDLLDTLATRMEALQRAEVALDRDVSHPETPPGA